MMGFVLLHNSAVLLLVCVVCSCVVCLFVACWWTVVVMCGLLGQVWNEGSSEDEVLAMVVRTGLCTTMGTMLLQVTKPPNRFQIHQDPFLRVGPLDKQAPLSDSKPSRGTGLFCWSNPWTCLLDAHKKPAAAQLNSCIPAGPAALLCICTAAPDLYLHPLRRQGAPILP